MSDAAVQEIHGLCVFADIRVRHPQVEEGERMVRSLSELQMQQLEISLALELGLPSSSE